MQNYKAVIFDIDGTLALPEAGNAWLELTKGLGASIEEHIKLYRHVVEKTLTPQDAKQALLDLWHAHGPVTRARCEQILASIPLRDGAMGSISYLQEKGYVLCLITGSPTPYAEVIAKQLRIQNYYGNDFYWDENDVLSDYDYDPIQDEKKLRQFNAFIAQNSFRPEECAVVGDDWNDSKLFSTTGNGIALRAPDGSVVNEELEKLAMNVMAHLVDVKKFL